MRVWLPTAVMIGVLSALFTWVMINLGKPAAPWTISDEDQRPPGSFDFDLHSASQDISVQRLGDSGIRVNAGRRPIGQELTIDLVIRNSGSGSIDVAVAGATNSEAVLPIIIAGKEMDHPQHGESPIRWVTGIAPETRTTVRIRWKLSESQRPDRDHKGFTFHIWLAIRNDPDRHRATIQVDCEPVRP